MLAVKTKNELQPFCYEHLTEMMPYDEAAVTYLCPVWDCLVSYTSSGYFIAAKKGDMVEQSTTPSIRCPNDGMPMYLAELNPEHRSYRLWKCPQCGKSLTNLSPSKIGNDPPKTRSSKIQEPPSGQRWL